MSDNKYVELLRQYRDGSISDIDRHALERAALDDPMLFDAMEGYSQYGSHQDIDTLNKIKQDILASHPEKVRRLPLRMMGVAASLLGLIAITFLLKDQWSESTTQSSSHEMVHNEKRSQPSEERLLVEEVIVPDDDESSVKVEELSEYNHEPYEEAQGVPTPPAATQNTSTEDSKSMKNLELENETESNASNVGQDPVRSTNANMDMNASDAPTYEDDMASRATAKRKESKPEADVELYDTDHIEGKTIRGKVYNGEGQPISNAIITIENTTANGTTDTDGNFLIAKYPRGHKLVVSREGYESQQIIIGELDTYQIILNKADEETSKAPEYIEQVGENKAFPEMGMDEFDLLVEQNMKYPIEVFGTGASSFTKISFTVKPDGTIADFVNEGSKCEQCFEEGVRLLKLSGKWITKPANSYYRTSYEFLF